MRIPQKDMKKKPNPGFTPVYLFHLIIIESPKVNVRTEPNID